MKWKFINRTGKKALILLALSTLLYVALSFEFQPSFAYNNTGSKGSIELIDFSHDALVPVSECNITVSPFSSQYSSVKENSIRVCAAIFNYNLTLESRFSQYLHFLHTLCIKYRKSDQLFPSHYFW